MKLMSKDLNKASFVDDPQMCITRDEKAASGDPRLEFPRALFIAVSTEIGDDVLLAMRMEESDEYDPPVLIFDWREKVPYRWTEQGKLSELINCIRMLDEGKKRKNVDRKQRRGRY